jgi:serine/threonine-protein kinase
MLSPGDNVAGRYEVIKQLAEGGMGVLWLAHHVELDVDVALKVISGRQTPVLLERFKREAQAAAKLGGPHIVKVLDYGVYDGYPYLAMELLRGEDLDARLQRDGRLSLDQCWRVIGGVAKGVQLAHDAGIIHRDLKPGNIFIEQVGDDENVKILDFGIAKDLQAARERGSLTGAGAVGSPEYMSPEQVWEGNVDAQTDVWAMGVVAFEMLTGTNPFSDETLAKVYERITRNPIPKLSSLRPGLAPRLDAFFERALARDAEHRFASARDFAVALGEVLEERFTIRPSEQVATVAEPLPYASTHAGATASGRERHRNRIWVVLGGVAGVAIVTAIAWRAQPTAPELASSASTPSEGAPAQSAPSDSPALARSAPTSSASSSLAPPPPSAPLISAATPSASPPMAPPPLPTTPPIAPSPKPLSPQPAPQPAPPPKPPSSPTPPAVDPDFGIPLR